MARRAGRSRTSPTDGALREGRARAEAVGQLGRCPARRSRPVPPRSRSAVDRADLRPPRCSERGGAVVSAAHLPATVERREPVVEARDVRLSFGATPALRSASLVVARSEILAIMGPSGSGKSTLLHCLAGILVPDSGEIVFAGQRVDTLGEEERSTLRREHFGFVFQFGQLVPELTAEENVALPLLLGGARRAKALDEARGWFDELDLEGLGERRSRELSGGQAQRVALARGLVAHPQVLFADEPTGALDSLTGEHVMNLLVAVARRQGTTVVLVTHEPRVAAVRLAVTTAAVALGVGMLLVVLAGMNAINAQNARTAWLNSGPLLGIVNAPGSPRGSHSTSSAKPLWWLLRTDYFGSQ